jgi:AbiV family abortive infection protein
MSEVDRIRPIFEACLANAENLLDSAKALDKPAQKHIAYHLAALALEEVGKASMLLTQLAPRLAGDDEDSQDGISPARFDDHERKLFWALWTPGISMGQTITADAIREFQGLARTIHDLRLASLYVDPNGSPVEVSDHDLRALISITQTRLEMEKAQKLNELDPVRQQALDWFLGAFEDQELRRIILSPDSFSKLAEFTGDSNKWMIWLRRTIEEINAKNQELLQKELQRIEAIHGTPRKPKWRLKMRFHTSTHSIRPKSIVEWNKGSEWIKLFTTSNKHELLVQFTLTSDVPVQAVWQAGLQFSTMFLVALNIGTVGFFWWYVPTFVAKYYEELFDLENQTTLAAERNPPLRIPVKREALKHAHLLRAGLVFAHMISATGQQHLAYGHYSQALSLLGKNDIFGQFEANILVKFGEAFRAGLIAYGDWDGAAETFGAAADAVLSTWNSPEAAADFKSLLELAATLPSRTSFERQITLDDAVKMKCLCDVYLIRCSNHAMSEAVKIPG